MFLSRRCYAILLMVLLRHARFQGLLFAVSVGKSVYVVNFCLQISGERVLAINEASTRTSLEVQGKS